jgi:uncharacterized membrane protein
MTTRIALYNLVARRQLDHATAIALSRIAGFDAQPPGLLAWFRRGLALIGAGLAGLGIIFWIAANWRSLSTFWQFALLQALVLVLCAGAATLPRARTPFSLLGLLATGGLFAYFGQTYQTGADPWQLFALWAALTLPLALAARSDSVWSAWAVVALAGVSLWDFARSGHGWRFDPGASMVHLVSACAALLVTLLLSALLRRYTGAGTWSFKLALGLSALFITTRAVSDLLDSSGLGYGVSLALLGVAAFAVAASSRLFDVFAASVIGLALNTLLLAGLVNVLSSGFNREPIGSLIMLGIAAAILLGLTVRAIMVLSQQYSVKGPAV